MTSDTIVALDTIIAFYSFKVRVMQVKPTDVTFRDVAFTTVHLPIFM